MSLTAPILEEVIIDARSIIIPTRLFKETLFLFITQALMSKYLLQLAQENPQMYDFLSS